MMILLKVLGPILVASSALLGWCMTYRWNDAKHRFNQLGRHAFLACIAVTLVHSVVVAVLDQSAAAERDRVQDERMAGASEDRSELKDKADNLERLLQTSRAENQRLLGSVDVLQAQNTALAEQIGTLQSRHDALSNQFAPVLALALEKYPDGTVQAALDRLLEEVRQSAELAQAAAQYSGVAKLNYKGLTGRVGGGLVESSRISRTLEGAWRMTDGKLNPNCDPSSIRKFREVTEFNPRFPFAHVALAICLSSEGKNDQALEHAKSAVEALSQTRRIEPHHPNHDEFYEQAVKRWAQQIELRN